jgi:protein-L-isoaspartate(D-aspartate) O-methyltransferase
VTHQNFDQMRHAMIVSQLRTNTVNDPRIVDAFASVARERFVPAERSAVAYVDVATPLDASGRALNPTLTSARLIAAAAPVAGASVLLIGAATGYLAAVLAHMGCRVTAVESDAALVATARDLLATETAVTLVEAPLDAGAKAHAPYDVLLIDGAVESVPDALVAQLRDGGQAAYACWDRGVTRLCLGAKVGATLSALPFVDMQAVRLPGFAAPVGFTF